MAAMLFRTATVDEQWREVVRPWIGARVSAAWRSRKPSVVLTPSRAESFYLRGRMVAEKIPHLGLRFWTPSDLRQYLHASLAQDIGSATQAELRVLARICAERLAGMDTSGVAGRNASIESVVRDPGAFLRAHDLLVGAGWDPAQRGAIYGRRLAADFQSALARLDVATQAGVHQALRRRAEAVAEPVLAGLLVSGFNATHWPLWDLLQAAVLSADEAVVALSAPREFGGQVDQLWIGSWEELTKTEALAPAAGGGAMESPAPFANLVAAYERGEILRSETNGAKGLSLMATRDLASQVRAVVLQTLVYLKDAACERIGIGFPAANALALGVAAELGRLGIAIDDGTGAPMPGAFERRSWQTWLTLQEEPGVPTLIAWLRACEAAGIATGAGTTLSAREIADLLAEELSRTLIDDLNFLARHLEETSRHERALAVARFLRGRVVLPEAGRFFRFLALTRALVEMEGWEEQRQSLSMEPPVWMLETPFDISRRTFLEWLRDATRSQVRRRGPEANHFYGKVHLVVYAQMTGQSWSHLILTGLNEGVWPPLDEAGAFGSRHELAALNQEVRRLNRHGEQQGGQGEGHATVTPGHGHCLLPLERRDLALRDLCAALESTRIAATLMTVINETGRSLLPSDFFNYAHQYQTGRTPDEDDLRVLAEATGEWCRRHDAVFAGNSAADSSLEELPLFSNSRVSGTVAAYTARRDAAQPFGRYEFAHEEPPLRPIQLTCKEWERAWRQPAACWLTQVVGAAPWPDGVASWANAIGIRVHRELAEGLREWREKKHSGAELPILVRGAADHAARAMRERAQAEKVALYPWWRHVWDNARIRAVQLSETLAVHLPEHEILSEYLLPPNLLVALPGQTQADFRLKGRVDFVRLEGEGGAVSNPEFGGRSCWIIDFKTGGAATLTEKSIAKGTGLQVALYALAIRALGAARVTVSLLAPESELKQPLEFDDRFKPILASLDVLHRRGIFGMRPKADADYGYGPEFPLATQFIPSSILEAKWELTHGAPEGTGA